MKFTILLTISFLLLFVIMSCNKQKVFNYPRPNFLIMLGNRYGWIPVPTEIELKYFDLLLEKVNTNKKAPYLRGFFYYIYQN